MFKSFISPATVVLLAGYAVHADVTLTADANSGHDGCWVKRYAAGVNSWGIVGNHVPGTNGYIWWNSFPGQTGTYKVELGAVLEPDGDSPYKFYVADQQVASGRYPYSTGTRDCGSSYLKTADLNLGEHLINQGAQIKYWASSVYPCGTDHGQYSRFYRIRFTLIGGVQDDTPPSAPTSVAVTSTTNTTISLSWAASSDPESGISGYRVYFGTNVMLTTSGSGTAATVGGLTRNTEYQNIAVTAINGRQLESAKSTAITARTADLSAPSGTMFIKAVDGVLENNMMIQSGVGGAMAGSAVYGTTGNTSAPVATDSKATYQITLATSGTWYAWGRFLFESDGQNNSYWIQVDGGAAQRFGNGEHAFGSWHWEGYMNTGAITLGTLSAGEHTLTIWAREPSEQSMLDVICLTPNAAYEPSDADVDFIAMAPITLSSPKGGEVYREGDTVTIRWSTIQSQVADVDVLLSVDGGENWTKLNATNSITIDNPSWGNYAWVVPGGMASSYCLVRIRSYTDNNVYADSPSVFTLTANGVTMAGRARRYPTTQHWTAVAGRAMPSGCTVVDMRGRAVTVVPAMGLSAGMYGLNMIRNAGRVTQNVLTLR